MSKIILRQISSKDRPKKIKMKIESTNIWAGVKAGPPTIDYVTIDSTTLCIDKNDEFSKRLYGKDKH